jgi:hypothetical protein
VLKLGRPGWFKINTGMRHGSIISSILYHGMLDGTSNKVKWKNERTGVKAILFSDSKFFGGKVEKKIEDKLNQ